MQSAEHACIAEMRTGGPELLTLRLVSTEGEDTLPLDRPMRKQWRSTTGRNSSDLSPTFAGPDMLTDHMVQSSLQTRLVDLSSRR